MPNFLGTSLADGQLPTSQAAIYTVPVGKVAYIRWASFHNTNAATQTVGLWVTRNGSTARRIDRAELQQNWTGIAFQDSSIELSAGDALEARTTTASAVDYIVCGALEDV